MRADVERRHPVAVEPEKDAQVGLDDRAVDGVTGSRRERTDFMCAE